MTWVSEQLRLPLGTAVLTVALLVLTACGDDSGDGGTASDEGTTPDDATGQASDLIAVPTSDWRPGDPGGRALLQGRLDMSDPSCPKVVRGRKGPGTVAVWPAGTYAKNASGTYGLFAEDGALLAEDGGRLALSGSTTTDVDPGCADAGGEVFLVEADVESADQ